MVSAGQSLVSSFYSPRIMPFTKACGLKVGPKRPRLTADQIFDQLFAKKPDRSEMVFMPRNCQPLHKLGDRRVPVVNRRPCQPKHLRMQRSNCTLTAG